MDSVKLALDPTAQHVLTGLLALIMFSVALGLKVDHFREVARRPLVVLGGFATQIIGLPLITLLLVTLLEPKPSLALGMFVVAACPGGNVSNFLTYLSRGDTALSVTLTAFSSAGAFLITPFSIVFWAGLYGPTDALMNRIGLDAATFLVQVTVMLAVPLALGMIVAHRYPGFAARLMPPLRWVSFVILIFFIVAATANNWSHLMAWGGIIVPLVILHNACALFLGFTAGLVLRARIASRKALLFEIGIQNSGLGLVIVLGHFTGLGGAILVTAMWGIWHIVSGLILASLLGRYATEKAPA